MPPVRSCNSASARESAQCPGGGLRSQPLHGQGQRDERQCRAGPGHDAVTQRGEHQPAAQAARCPGCPLPRLPAAEARPTHRSLNPCVRARSSGVSWSASNVEPPTKHRFQPSPRMNSATASGTTSGESVASMQASTSPAAPRAIVGRRPQRSASRPETTENAYIPSVCDEMTAETSPSPCAWARMCRLVMTG